MFTKFIALFVVVFPFGSRFKVNADSDPFNPAMDFWRQMSSTMDHKQYKSLHDLINQNTDTKKAELEEKVGEWAKSNGLEVGFKL